MNLFDDSVRQIGVCVRRGEVFWVIGPNFFNLYIGTNFFIFYQKGDFCPNLVKFAVDDFWTSGPCVVIIFLNLINF